MTINELEAVLKDTSKVEFPELPGYAKFKEDWMDIDGMTLARTMHPPKGLIAYKFVIYVPDEEPK